MKMLFLLCFILLFFSYFAAANDQARPIQDNSFLIEEAYNQEPGIVQHINSFGRNNEGNWIYTFTEEWPLIGQKHQIGIRLPIQRTAESSSGLGDLIVNYRYQATGNANSIVAIAPRFSLIIPTGNEVEDRGRGAVGFQGNLPISLVLQKHLVTHFNAGLTYTHSARNRLEQRADATSYNVGQSVVYEPSPNFNFLLEVAWQNLEAVTGERSTMREYSFFLNPGIRWAHNFGSGLQIVPGIAVPIGLGPSNKETGIFLYLSFKHRFKHDAN